MTTLLDVLLALGLLWLGWQVASGHTMFRSIVMFVVLGLLMAVVWARLGAPDLALAEAAVGAGVTGAMLMLTYRRLLEIVPRRVDRKQLRRSRLALPVGMLCGGLVLALGWLMLALPTRGESAGDVALKTLPDSEMGNAVTGVLLLYRGYDTLLEIGVLLVAWMGAKIVQPVAKADAPTERTPAPIVNALLAALIPGAVLVAGYLLHAGGQAPGGAFQAGAVLAAAGVLLALSGRLESLSEPHILQRVLLVGGLVVFSTLALVGIAWGKPAMTLPGLWAVYVVEAALTVSIAMVLMLLFLGAGGVRRRRP